MSGMEERTRWMRVWGAGGGVLVSPVAGAVFRGGRAVADGPALGPDVGSGGKGAVPNMALNSKRSGMGVVAPLCAQIESVRRV